MSPQKFENEIIDMLNDVTHDNIPDEEKKVLAEIIIDEKKSAEYSPLTENSYNPSEIESSNKKKKKKSNKKKKKKKKISNDVSISELNVSPISKYSPVTNEYALTLDYSEMNKSQFDKSNSDNSLLKLDQSWITSNNKTLNDSSNPSSINRANANENAQLKPKKRKTIKKKKKKIIIIEPTLDEKRDKEKFTKAFSHKPSLIIDISDYEEQQPSVVTFGKSAFK